MMRYWNDFLAQFSIPVIDRYYYFDCSKTYKRLQQRIETQQTL